MSLIYTMQYLCYISSFYRISYYSYTLLLVIANNYENLITFLSSLTLFLFYLYHRFGRRNNFCEFFFWPLKKFHISQAIYFPLIFKVKSQKTKRNQQKCTQLILRGFPP